MNVLRKAREVLRTEAQAIGNASRAIGGDFVKAVSMILSCRGKVIVTGLGKSGIIGKKIAATLSSSGSPACFMHAGEALLGDIGIVNSGDVAIMLSYSGETEEIVDLLPALKRKKVKIISITGRKMSRLARESDCVINAGIRREADLLGIMPTASSTAMLAIGDALAVCVSMRRGFSEKNFAMTHPGGVIGKKLLMRVGDIMRKGKNNPVIGVKTMVRDALIVMTRTRLGATSVVNGKGVLEGFFTDGDLRRNLQKDDRVLYREVREVMTKTPVTITGDRLAIEALRLMKRNNFDNVPVVDKNKKPVGIVDERDMLEEGIDE